MLCFRRVNASRSSKDPWTGELLDFRAGLARLGLAPDRVQRERDFEGSAGGDSRFPTRTPGRAEPDRPWRGARRNGRGLTNLGLWHQALLPQKAAAAVA
jgi:hypothetical protein